MAYITSDQTIRHIPKFGGELWFVSAGMATSGDGTTPDEAFKTIGEAITACSSGDAITVMAGTYTETGLDINKNSVELWCEIGTIIDPASGTALTVSGDYCRVNGDVNNVLKITPAADEIGIAITGIGCCIHSVMVSGSASLVGFDVDGVGNEFCSCRVTGIKATGKCFDIGASQTKLLDCSVAGTTTSYGYFIGNGSISKGILINCTSVGNETSGFYIDSNVEGFTLLNCSSGSGDGKWRDIDTASVWSKFSYDDNLYSTMTLDGSTSYNLFKVTGAIQVFNIFAHVTTIIANTSSTMNLELYSTSSSVDITNSVGGPNIQSDVVGTVYTKFSVSTDPLEKGEPNVKPAIIENDNYRNPDNPIILIEDDSADTYIQAVLSDAVASGVLHWHVEWRPITDDGFLETA